jgi:hypothetical protein
MNKKQLIVACMCCRRELKKEEAVEVTACYFGRKSKRVINKIVYFDIECFSKKQIEWDTSARIRAKEMMDKYPVFKKQSEKQNYERELNWMIFRELNIAGEYFIKDSRIVKGGIQADILVRGVYKEKELLFVGMGNPKRLKKFFKQQKDCIENRICRRRW